MKNNDDNYFVQNPLNNNFSKIKNSRTKANNSTQNSKISNKTLKRNQIEEKIHNKRVFRVNKSLINNNSLLESYFELKNKDKCVSLSNYDIFNKNEKRGGDSTKNSRSFNNLNILNNFYNLDYSKKSATNDNRKKIVMSHFNSNKNYDTNKIKLYNETLNKLIPHQFNQFNKTFNI